MLLVGWLYSSDTMKKKVRVKVTQSCPNCLQPHGLYTVHGILQARILERVAVPFSGGSS